MMTETFIIAIFGAVKSEAPNARRQRPPENAEEEWLAHWRSGGLPLFEAAR